MSELSSSFKLIIEDDEGRRSVVPVELGEITIGRHEGCTIRLKERNVSRRHATIRRENGNLVAEDLDSDNGVFINGARIEKRRTLHDGDRIGIGDFRLELRGEASAEKTHVTPKPAEPLREATQPYVRLPPPNMQEPAPVALEAATTEVSPLPAAPVPQEFEAHEATAIIRPSARPERLEAAAGPLAKERPRLLCLSTNLAGRCYDIAKNDVVLGRTDDNDIVLDHRSVSRHHSRIVVQGEQTRVIDLGSANGTLVNGEEYAELLLKEGDVITLGHVKLQFVPAGAPLPEHTSVSSARPAAKHHAALLAMLSALALSVALGLFWQSRHKAAPPPVVKGDAVQAQILAQARAAVAQHHWVEAQGLASAVLAQHPGHQEAQEILAHAQAEAVHQAALERAIGAHSRGDWREAWEALQGIPASSMYNAQAQPLRGPVRAAWFYALQEQAQKQIEAQAWDEATRIADDMAALDPSRPEVTVLRDWIADGRQQKAKPQASKKLLGQLKAKSFVAATPTGGDPQVPFAEGLQALNAGKLQTAIERLSQCVERDPKFARCYRALGIVYARLGDGPNAAHFYQLYLQTDPTASDAEQVKQLLRQYEAPH